MENVNIISQPMMYLVLGVVENLISSQKTFPATRLGRQLAWIVHILSRKELTKVPKDSVMATKPSKSDLADSVQIALDAADTATGVTEEFNSIKEQFEVVNIQAKRIHQSVTIIFVSAIAAAIVSLAAGFLMYYKSLSTLQTNSNIAIEYIAMYTERVEAFEKSVKTVEDNTQNQETIKATLSELKSATEKATKDLADADNRYNKGIKLGIQDTERLIKEFAQTLLEDLRNQSEASQVAMSEQIAAIESYFAPEDISQDVEETEANQEELPITIKDFQVLENKVDELMLLQKEIAANLLEMNRVRQVQAKRKKATPKPQPKPKPNPLKFP